MQNCSDALKFLEELYATKYRTVYKQVCWKLYARGFDTQEAADVTQEVFIRCAKNIEKVAAHPNPGGWLASTAEFVCKEYARARAACREDPTEDIDLNAAPDDAYAELDARLSLEQMLSPEEYALLKAYCIERRPTEQICREAGISDNVLRVRIHRLKKKLSPFFVILVIFAGARNI